MRDPDFTLAARPAGVSYGSWRWVAVIPYLVACGVELLSVDQTDLKAPW